MDTIETSKTHRLYLFFKERIVSGALAPGQRLPSEPRLAVTHGLSRVTIRRALDGLSRDGLVSRRQGLGTFVTPSAASSPLVADLSNLLAQLALMGRTTRVRLLACNYVTPPAAIATALKLENSERAQHALRVRMLDGKPFSYLSTHVPERIGVTYSAADLRTTPILELLERSGLVVDKANQIISATLAGPEAAAALNVEIGSPLLSLTRVVFCAEGRAIEHLVALYRPDMYAVNMEMVRSGRNAARYWQPATAQPIGKPAGRTRGPKRNNCRNSTRGRRL